MNWDHETWRRLYVREEGSFAALPYTARALAGYLLKICDARGRIFPAHGEDIRDSICFRLGMSRSERRLNRPAIDQLLEDGYLVAGERGSVRIKNLARANPDVEDASTEHRPSVEPDSTVHRTGLEPDSNVSRTCIEECVKSAESLTPPENPPVPADPVGARAFQISSSLLLPSEPDPERAIPVPPATVHHAVVRYRAPRPGGVNPPAREAPGLRAQRLVDTFGRVRSEVGQAHGQGSAPWHHGPGDFAKAVEFVEWLDGKGGAVTVGEVERTMRAHLEWAVRQPERKHFEVGWAFGTWKHRFSDWLEEVRGQRQPELPGLTDKDRKNVANMQRWYDRKEEQSREPQDIRR